MQEQITFTRPALLKKTREQLVDLLFTQSKALEESNAIIEEQFDTIARMQEFKVNVENEAKENIKQQTHVLKINNSIAVSERRIKLVSELLEPIIQEGYKEPYVIIDNENIIRANSVIQNELEKIVKQQQVELKKSLEVK